MINEKRHAGEEHCDPLEVARFDEKLPFDPEPEIQLLKGYGLAEEDTIIDFGTGTGVFPLAIADHCNRVIALDVSEEMLDVIEEEIGSVGVENIQTIHDGFLSYEHLGEPVAFAFSKDALHHLPDFWKVEALKNIGNSLREGGIFRLRDFTFSFEPDESLGTIESWIDEKKEVTRFSDEEIHVHFRDEYSTYAFLMEQMLERVGFKILDSAYPDEFYATYICRWSGPGNLR